MIANKQHSRIRLWVILLPALVMAGIWSYGSRNSLKLKRYSGHTMGTTWSITLDAKNRFENDTATLERLPTMVQAELDKLELIFSTWRGDSEISRLNRCELDQAGSESMRELMDLATGIGKHNDNFLDFGLQAVLEKYGFERDGSAESIAGNGVAPGCTVEGEASAKSLNLNFSAIAKGYAVDVIGRRLTELGFDHTLVEIGGEMTARCAAKQPAWRIAIQNPTQPRQASAIETLELCDASLATSGDYRNFNRRGEEIDSHLIDPTTRQPKRNATRSVSVIAQDTATADAYATAFAISGLAGSERVYVHAPLRVLFITQNADRTLSKTWKTFIPSEDEPN